MDSNDYKTFIWIGIVLAGIIGLWALFAGVALFLHILAWVLPKLVVVVIIAFILKYLNIVKF